MVLDTEDPEEIISTVLALKESPNRAVVMRSMAQERAASFTWEEITKILLEKIRFIAQAEGALPRRDGNGLCLLSDLEDVVLNPFVA